MISPKAPLPENLLAILNKVAGDPGEPVELRARALRLLVSTVDRNLDAVVAALAPLTQGEGPPALVGVWEEFARDPRHAKRVNVYSGLARDEAAPRRLVGATVLINLITNPIVTDSGARRNAHTALDTLWKSPASAITLLEVIGRARAADFLLQVEARLADPDAGVAAAARAAHGRLARGPEAGAGARPIGGSPYDELVQAVLATPGDARRGQELFLQRACFACHTVSPHEPPKGPMLGGIAQRYSRAELTESILKPSAKIAQGFESQLFKLRNGQEVEGFVVREGGDNVDVRNVAGATTTLEKGDIALREKREASIMPEGLMTGATVADLAALLTYLETTGSK
ncbi:MAG: c-type cytochrome [Verrucomicrobia bacterium]|nr:c-type cytochrome [Verrucomicrobiota bacterium]